MEGHEAVSVEPAELTGIEDGQEVHPKVLGLMERPLKAQFAIDCHVRKDEGKERQRQDEAGRGCLGRGTPGQAFRAEQEDRGGQRDEEEPESIPVVEGREHLGPHADRGQREAPPGALQEEPADRPDDEREEERLLKGELADVIHPVRVEREHDTGQEARLHPPGDRIGQEIGQRPARHKLGEQNEVDGEDRLRSEAEERGGQ